MATFLIQPYAPKIWQMSPDLEHNVLAIVRREDGAPHCMLRIHASDFHCQIALADKEGRVDDDKVNRRLWSAARAKLANDGLAESIKNGAGKFPDGVWIEISIEELKEASEDEPSEYQVPE